MKLVKELDENRLKSLVVVVVVVAVVVVGLILAQYQFVQILRGRNSKRVKNTRLTNRIKSS